MDHDKRRTLQGIGAALTAGLAGCAYNDDYCPEDGTDTPAVQMERGLPDHVHNGTQYDPEETPSCGQPYATDQEIYVTDVVMTDDGERDCYHEVHGTLINARDETVSPRFDMWFFDEDGEVLLEFTKQVLEVGPGEVVDIHHQEQMPCFSSTGVAGYGIAMESLDREPDPGTPTGTPGA